MFAKSLNKWMCIYVLIILTYSEKAKWIKYKHFCRIIHLFLYIKHFWKYTKRSNITNGSLPLGSEMRRWIRRNFTTHFRSFLSFLYMIFLNINKLPLQRVFKWCIKMVKILLDCQFILNDRTKVLKYRIISTMSPS